MVLQGSLFNNFHRPTYSSEFSGRGLLYIARRQGRRCLMREEAVTEICRRRRNHSLKQKGCRRCWSRTFVYRLINRNCVDKPTCPTTIKLSISPSVWRSKPLGSCMGLTTDRLKVFVKKGPRNGKLKFCGIWEVGSLCREEFRAAIS